MISQETFGTPKIANPGGAHMACVLLVDTSYSMEGEAIDNLNQAIKDFRKHLASDEMVQKCLDICIVSFNSEAKVVVPFTPISQMEPITLTVDGTTAMSKGIHLAIDQLKERNRFYNELGTPVYIPWLFMITDGLPDGNDDIESARERIELEESKGSQGKLRFLALGVPGYDKNTLVKLTMHQGENPRIMELGDFDFAPVLRWIAESMKVISVSRVGEKPALPRLPEEVKKIDPQDTSDW
ncbi:MAG: VWA domain-containing protein [Lachnospiraceae bacterium]|jgi:uncharacterized protein YegL|nr:VWA domain-containing protein [Lachnospiraceae bacterium]